MAGSGHGVPGGLWEGGGEGRHRAVSTGDAAGLAHRSPSPAALARAALARGEWEHARSGLEVAVAAAPSDPTLWELLGIASTWVQDADRAIHSRERAYALYREAGADLASARVSLELANDYFEVRGEPAVANGWFQRARRLLDGAPPSRERVLLRIWDAYMALVGEGDAFAGARNARDAAALARETGAKDMEMLGLALQGLACVTAGQVRDGLTLLDEAVAAVLGQEVTDPQWFYLTCCCMIDACDQVRDFERALEWCHRLREFAGRWGVQAFLTTCRVKYAGALLWRGEWERCEGELMGAIRELERDRPSGLPAARVRLAELRRRQGRRPEAEALLEGAQGHPLEPQVRAGISLDAGDSQGAANLLEGVLRRLPPEAPTERVPILELLVRARARAGEIAEARRAADELSRITDTLGTPALRAAALEACGVAAAARGDHSAALPLLEDAVHLYLRCGAPFEAARTRRWLAHSLGALGREEVAGKTAAEAEAILDALGVHSSASSGPSTCSARGTGSNLTRRQREILTLVARGMTNREIAGALHLSEHTVHRHLANILRRLGAASRPAAVAQAVREGWV